MTTVIDNARFKRRRLPRLPAALIGGIVIVGASLLFALLPHHIVPLDPNIQDYKAVLKPPSWAHPFGTDNFGRDMLSNLRTQGVNVRHLTVDRKQPTGVAAILVAEDGQNSIVVVPGANGSLTPADVQRAAPAIRKADVLLCQLEVPLDTTQAAFAIARAGRVQTILNPAPALMLTFITTRPA